MASNKTIVLMHNHSKEFNTLNDKLSDKYSCISIRTAAAELSKLKNNSSVSLFVIDFSDSAKADILYLCDRLNNKAYANIPIIYTGSYYSHSIFTSKIHHTHLTKYVSTPVPDDLLRNIDSAINSIGDGNSTDNDNTIMNSLTDNTPSAEEIFSKKPSILDISPKEEEKPVPAINTAAANLASAISQNAGSQTTSPSGKPRVLVIDDDVTLLNTVATYLHDNFEVSAVRTTAAAFMNIGRNKPDIILLDYMMPVCDGYKTLMMIRNQYETSKIPVIMLTSFTDKERVVQCLELGISGYLVKPVNKDDLINAIENAIK